ncbi:MAG: DNA-processing protein DprA [Sandaracinus sp.]
MGPRARTLLLDGPGYPAALRRLSSPPARLHVDGSLDGLERAVGIVGTRRATPAALELAHEMGEALAAAGWVVVSGGAEGIDRAAHEGALAARSGRTVAVLPTALDQPYPPSHAPLFSRIATRGARLSEHAERGPIYRAHFLERNRIIAALSRVVVVVQAPARSGALRTALDARQLGLPVLSVPWSPREPLAEGGVALLVDGARACRHADDVLRVLGDERPTPARKPSRAHAPRDPDEQAVLAALGHEATSRDAVLGASGLPAARAQAALLHLLLEGQITEDAQGLHRVTRRPRR